MTLLCCTLGACGGPPSDSYERLILQPESLPKLANQCKIETKPSMRCRDILRATEETAQLLQFAASRPSAFGATIIALQQTLVELQQADVANTEEIGKTKLEIRRRLAVLRIFFNRQ